MENRLIIEDMIKSFCGIFYIGTNNYHDIIESCLEIAEEHSLEAYQYNISMGLIKKNVRVKNDDALMDPLQILDMILDIKNKGFSRKLFILEYFDIIMDCQDPLVMTKLMMIRDQSSLMRTVILLGSPEHKLPGSIKNIPRIDFRSTSRNDIISVINQTNYKLLPEKMGELVSSMEGLDKFECENILALSLTKKHAFDPDFIEENKTELISKKIEGLFTVCTPRYTLNDIGGLDKLKSWLDTRGRLIHSDTHERFPLLPHPRGVLLAGPPGCGKSFITEAIAGSWGLKLIRFQPSRCFNSLVGQTEQNFLTAFNIIKENFPNCVLIFDEFDKFFSSQTDTSSDGGISSRVLGILLDFLQSERDGIFVCATTNAVHTLPPEITRALRFDACWFIDLPQPHERKQILNALFQRYGLQDHISINETTLNACQLFSAAEMEQAITEAMVYCAVNDSSFNEFILVKAFNDVVPLAVSREKEILSIREWAVGRARMASTYNNDFNSERSRTCPISQR